VIIDHRAQLKISAIDTTFMRRLAKGRNVAVGTAATQLI
jgi:hypothetical protein